MAEMKRGANVALTREIPGLQSLVLGVTWNAGAERVLDDNLVLAAVLCGPDGRARNDQDFVFFNQISSPEQSTTGSDRFTVPQHRPRPISIVGWPHRMSRTPFTEIT